MSLVRLIGFASVVCVWLAAVRVARAETVVPSGTVGGQTWTAAGSPYFVQGDITVQAGSTLTIEAGTTVELAVAYQVSDGGMSTGTELIVNGMLDVRGTPASPVTFQARGSTIVGSWFGIEVTADAAGANVTGAVIKQATYGIMSLMNGPQLVVSRSRFEDDATAIQVYSGSAALSDISIFGSASSVGIALGADAVAATITNCLVAPHGPASTGISTGGSNVRIVNCTIDGAGVAIEAGSGTIDILNTIVTNSDLYGVYHPGGGGTLTVSYCDFWRNATDFVGASAGTGTISVNPYYVNDWHLDPASPCVDSGSNADAPDHDLDGTPRPLDGKGIADPGGAVVDMGAYEYDPAGTNGVGGASGAGGSFGTGGFHEGAGVGGQAGNAASSSGCGCEAGGSAGLRGLAPLTMTGLALSLARKRRRARR